MFNTLSRILLIIPFCSAVVGCANQSAQNYYLAMQQTAAAQAQVAQARYDSLARMAMSGNGETKAAAVMALALYQPHIAQPAYVESEALKFTQALAGPVAAVAGVYINSQQAVDLAEINAGTQQARLQYDAQNQQAAYGALAAGNQSSAAAAAGAFEFATTAINTVSDFGQYGLDSTVAVAGLGFDAVGQSIESNNALTERFLDSVDSAVLNGYDFSTGVLTQTYDWSQFLIVEPTVIEVPAP